MKKNKKESCSINDRITKIKTIEDAIITLCILGISTDGDVSSKEMDSIFKILSICPIFKDVKKSKEKYLNCIISSLVNRRREELIDESIKVIPEKLRPTAYAWVYFALKSDKKVLNPEHKFLDEIMKHFKIPGPLAGKIKAVVEIILRNQ